MKNIDTVKFIDLSDFWKSGGTQTDLFADKMLATYRQDVIKIKDGLRLSLERVGGFWSILALLVMIVVTAWKIRNKVGKVTKENSAMVTTHRLLEHKEKFMRIHHNAVRGRMVEAAYDIIIAINEHDWYWMYILGWESKQVMKDMVAGRWPEQIEVPDVLKASWNSALEKELD